MEFDTRLLISLGTTLCTLAGAFAVIRWEVRNLNKIINDIEGRIRGLDKTTDRQEVQLSNHAQSLNTYGEMLSPKERENRAMVMADVQARLNATEAEVQRLRSLHNGRHPEVQK